MKKWLFRILLIILGLPVLLVLLVAVAYLLANRTNGSIISSGEKRSYLLYVPDSYDPAVPTPLVISIHGFVEWPAHQQQISKWNDLADQHGFIVVYPSGTGFPLRWQTRGTLEGTADPWKDVTFISDLIDKLSTEYNIDPGHIYANGLSNGAGMSLVLSCRLADKIAAIGTVAGAYALPWDQCQPSRPVPAIIFHGTADPIVWFHGDTGSHSGFVFPDIAQWVSTLADRNGCDDNPQVISPIGDVSGVRYNNCEADVVFYTIEGGGHTWPGGDPLPERIAGSTNMDISATQLMWDFFLEH